MCFRALASLQFFERPLARWKQFSITSKSSTTSAGPRQPTLLPLVLQVGSTPSQSYATSERCTLQLRSMASAAMSTTPFLPPLPRALPPGPTQALPPRRPTIQFSPAATRVLEQAYEACPDPSPEVLINLATALRAEQDTIRAWFEERRPGVQVVLPQRH